jgi:hypothetical protein
MGGLYCIRLYMLQYMLPKELKNKKICSLFNVAFSVTQIM